jgi:hypothetical protein
LCISNPKQEQYKLAEYYGDINMGALKSFQVDKAFIFVLFALLCFSIYEDLLLFHRILQPLHFFNAVVASYIIIPFVIIS